MVVFTVQSGVGRTEKSVFTTPYLGGLNSPVPRGAGKIFLYKLKKSEGSDGAGARI